jgi:carbamoyl-phosphate synthase small subunit
VAGFVMRESSPVASNWRADQTLRDYPDKAPHRRDRRLSTPARSPQTALGRRAARRDRTGAGLDPQQLVARAGGIRADGRQRPGQGRDLQARLRVEGRRRERPGFLVPPERRASRRLRIAAYDLGIKFNILRRLAAHNCDVTVFPASAPAEDLLAIEPDGIFLSNGPGDPAALPYVVDNARTLVTPTCRCSASAWATRCWAWRWAARPSS